jgi:hypothetical protein
MTKWLLLVVVLGIATISDHSNRCGNLERSNRDALAVKLQSMGRLQLRGSEGFAENAQGNGT